MVHLYLLMLLAVPLMPGFAQSYPSPGDLSKEFPRYPIASRFEHLSVKEGLSNNSVTCMLQDRDGFMWFGTNEGLNKYDGSTFTVFQPDPRNPARSLQNSHITNLHEDGSNRLWVVTEGGGLHEVNKRTGLVTPHPIKTGSESDHHWNNQLSVYEDNQGFLWISTFAGLARYEPARHYFTLYPSPQPAVPIETVFEDRQHRFWVGTNKGLYLLDRSTGKFTAIPAPVAGDSQPAFMAFYLDADDVLWLGTAKSGYSLFRLNLRHHPWNLVPYDLGGQLNPFIYLNSIHRDTRGVVWMGTTDGLQGIDPVAEKVYTYRTNPNTSKGLSSNNAQAVYHDRSGMLWVGTDNGIDRQSVTTKSFETYRVTPNENRIIIARNRVNAIAKDKRGQLWLSNMSTVYRLSVNQDRFDVIPPYNLGTVGQHKNYVSTLLPDESGGIWFGTWDGLYHFDQVSGRYTAYPSDIPVQYVDRAPTGDLWVGGEGGIASFNIHTHRYTYYKYNQGSRGGLTDKYVNGLLASRTGDVWVLIKQLGIYRLNPQSGRFIRYTVGPTGHLTSNDVETIYEDKAGIIWVGTHQGGLNRFDPKTQLFSAISHQDGIPGNNVAAITSDLSGTIWLSTNNGLCRYNPRTKAIHSYEVTDGLPSNEFLQNAVFQQGDQLFFGSMNGVVQFNPDRIRDDTRPFPVYITELTVMDQPRPLTDSIIHLKYDENMLSFSFAALSYEQPEQNQFAYQLAGVNSNWVRSGNRHFANYTNLSPGTYTFRVKAANSDGVWTRNEASLQLIIRPPWWATWWAYGLYALLAGGAIWGYIRFYTNRIRQRQELALNRQQAEQLKAVDELKTRFFANITHEFRTPLSLIIAPVETLLQESRFDRPLLTTVHRNAGQLLRLINQLLDLSKLESNYMGLSPVQGRVTDFVNYIVERFERMAEQQGVTLTYTTDQLIAGDYVFDADNWEKILTNLIANALRFTPRGGQVRLSVTPVLVADEISGVQIKLADSGIGIDPDKLPHIFDRFYQVDTSSTRAYGGTGIGLALVHELVGLLGGTIAVESQPKVGTTFHLTLPVEVVSTGVDLPKLVWSASEQTSFVPSDSPAPFPNTKPDTIENDPRPRVLVVEDNSELREFLVSQLSASYQILQAADGQAGWEMTQAELPDMVLTDVMMPRMDGYELTRLIKAHAGTDHIAVVMLTAKAAQPSRLEGLQQGADDYLSKPFSVDELHLRIGNLVSRQQKLGAYYRQRFALPQSRPAPDASTPKVLTGPSEGQARLGFTYAHTADSPGWSADPVSQLDPFLQRVYDLLEQHLDDPSLKVEWLADQLAITRKTLYRKVQSLIQLTPADVIRQYRLRKAADLLAAGYNVTETADEVGFSTPSHFSIVFKEFYHQTPTEYIASQIRRGKSV